MIFELYNQVEGCNVVLTVANTERICNFVAIFLIIEKFNSCSK